MRMTAPLSLTVFCLFALTASAEPLPTKVVHDQLPGSKQTVAKLYVNSEEAYDVCKGDSENVKVIDVRTVQEYAFIGHPTMAYNVPFLFATRKWDPEAGCYAMEPNEHFLDQIRAIATPDDLLLVTCRSGQRSAGAANLLTEAGYKNVYSVVDGFEGDKVKDPDSQFDGQRKKNGWRNAGLPWTYRLDPNLVYRVEE